MREIGSCKAYEKNREIILQPSHWPVCGFRQFEKTPNEGFQPPHKNIHMSKAFTGKVVHLTAGNLFSGAGKGVVNLHLALLESGVDSWIISSHRPYNPAIPNVDWLLKSLTDRLIFSVRQRLQNHLTRTVYLKRVKLYSFAPFGLPVASNNKVKAADVINLHWINGGMVSLRGIKGIGKLNKPVVWTLRDMWPFTGGCHYSLDCRNFESGCGGCPLLESKRTRDLSYRHFQKKKEALASVDRLYPVAISPWIKEEAEKSKMFGNRPIEMIWNGVDIGEFPIKDKAESKKTLKIPINKKVILIGATDPSHSYKGGALIVPFLKQLKAKFQGKAYSECPLVAFFGRNTEDYLNYYTDVLEFGFVKDYELLNTIYSSADVFLMPSVQEAFGKTVVESLASGTPVVCFEGTGPGSLIEHKVTGYLACLNSVSSLLDGVVYCFSKGDVKGHCCREASYGYSHLSSGQKYLKLYDKIH
jgi:glycosyltransferase involved in cell wall biosynthesis